MAKLIDASNVNGVIDWKAVRKSGVTAAFIKATEGRTYTDPDFAWNRAQAAKAGIAIGAYHFARPDDNGPEAEAAHFVAIVKSLGKYELRPVLDFETSAKLTPANMVDWARRFNKAVRKGLGAWPIFYCYPSMLSALAVTKPIGSGLWLASYGANNGKRNTLVVPRPWRKIILHQFTSRGRVPGIKGYVDLDYAVSVKPLLAHPIRGRKAAGGGTPPKAV